MVLRLFHHIRHRRVLRVAGAYTVAAWGVLQAAEAVLPLLDVPDWSLMLLAAMLLMGLPLSVVLAWVLHLPMSPPPDPTDDARAASVLGGHWLDVGILVGVVLVLAVTSVQLATGARRADAVVAGPNPGAQATVAVLPFTNFGDQASDDYFADGLTEELINSLTQLPGLQVPGRTSSFYFKGRNEDLREIGRQLGVAQVLEGSVRRSGERVRVTVQLVSAVDGFHLWSQTYDRTLEDVFAIQDDISRQVAAALELTLLSDPADAPEPGSYPGFLMATALLRERTPASVTEARRLFEEVLRRDPDDVEALAGYARATIILAGSFLTVEFEPAAKAAEEAVKRALELDANSVPANLAAGQVFDVLAFRTDEQHYLAQAERALARAADLAPGDPEVLRTYGGLLLRLDRMQAALEVTQRGVARDPLDLAARLQLAEVLRAVGRPGAARRELERTLERAPDYTAAQLELGELLMETGSLDEALPYLWTAHAVRTSPRATFALANVYLNLGMNGEVRRTIAELDYAPLSLPLGEMVLRLMSGDDAGALTFAESQLQVTGDRIWRPMVVLMALISGDLDKARLQLRQLEPALLSPLPDVTRAEPSTVLLAANLLRREGRESEAARILDALLVRLAPPAGGFDPVAGKLLRAQALAELGRADDALAELAAARLQGYRTLFDFDHFLRLDRYPAFDRMRGEPRFRAFVDGLAADNRAIGAHLEAHHSTASARLG